MSNKLTYRVSPNSITVVVDGFVRSLDKTAINFAKVREALKEVPPDHNLIKDLLDISTFIARETFGRVTVSDDQVRFDNIPVHNVLATRILEHLQEGFSIAPLANFMNRLMANPLTGVRDDLFAWIESGDMPVTDDGYLLAYKAVQDDYYSYHSGKTGKVLHALNTVVTMPRQDVDDNRRNECSYGLHFCSYGYLAHYHGGGKVIIVKIDPADVVAIPMDYNRQKGRTWRMEVIGEINKAENADALRGRKVISKLGSYDAAKPSTALTSQSDSNVYGNDAKGNAILEGRIRGLLAHGGIAYAAAELGQSEDTISAWAEQIDFKPENLGSLDKVVASPKPLDVKADPVVAEYINANGVEYGAAVFIILTTKEVGGEETWKKLTHSSDEGFRKAANHFRAITTNEADAKAKFLLSVAAFEPVVEEPAPAPTKENKKKTKGLSFSYGDTNYTAAKVLRGVEDNGQRGYSALTGIPRTTLQGWLKQIKAETSV